MATPPALSIGHRGQEDSINQAGRKASDAREHPAPNKRLSKAVSPSSTGRDDDYAVVDGDIRIGPVYRDQVPAGVKWMRFLTSSPNSANALNQAKIAIEIGYRQCPKLMLRGAARNKLTLSGSNA